MGDNITFDKRQIMPNDRVAGRWTIIHQENGIDIYSVVARYTFLLNHVRDQQNRLIRP